MTVSSEWNIHSGAVLNLNNGLASLLYRHLPRIIGRTQGWLPIVPYLDSLSFDCHGAAMERSGN